MSSALISNFPYPRARPDPIFHREGSSTTYTVQEVWPRYNISESTRDFNFTLDGPLSWERTSTSRESERSAKLRNLRYIYPILYDFQSEILEGVLVEVIKPISVKWNNWNNTEHRSTRYAVIQSLFFHVN